jgi:hypothetical protein
VMQSFEERPIPVIHNYQNRTVRDTTKSALPVAIQVFNLQMRQIK